MKYNFGNTLITPAASIKDAFESLQTSSQHMLLLVDDAGKLIRTITDGDLRRLILGGFTLESALNNLPEKSPITANEGIDSGGALDIMDEYQIDQLPIVNDEDEPLEIWLRRDLDRRILLSTPHMGNDELAYVEEAFRTNWIAPLGPNVDAFEKEIVDYLEGDYYAAALSSGTAALHLALKLLGVTKEDTVFCSSLTFVASANPILYEHATPVFIDSEPDTWNMSPAALERALKEYSTKGNLPKAMIVVNLYGQSADFEPIIALSEKYGVPIIEDAAESLGASYRNKKSGTFGSIGVFSFNGNKIITTSGGGMMVSANEDYIKKARYLSTQARENAPYYEHIEVGYNYRMSNVLAGIGRGQLHVLDDRASARRGVFNAYVEGLKEFPEISWQYDLPESYATHWLTACKLPEGVKIANLIAYFSERGIEARNVWKPMHMQPLFADADYYPHAEDYDVSKDLFDTGVCLPSGSNLTTSQVEKIIDVFKSFLS
jgi:dTDP-4-amino-4,6-dideoxygalactose transaminase